MATITEVKLVGGGVSYRVQTRSKKLAKVLSKTFKSRAEAEMYAQQEDDGLRRYKNIGGSKMTVAELHEEFLTSKQFKEYKPKSAKSALEHCHLYLEHFGKSELGSLSRAACMDFIDKLQKRVTRFGKPASAGNVRNHFRQFSALLSYAVKKGYIDLNPAHGIELDQPKSRAIRIPKAVLTLIFESLKDVSKTKIPNRPTTIHYVFYRILFYAGCRPGELAKLRWSGVHVNEENRTPYLVLTDHKIIKKTEKPLIKMLPYDVAEDLRNYQEECEELDDTFDENDFVFFSYSFKNEKIPYDHRIGWQSVTRRLDPELLQVSDGLGEMLPITPYTLRHEFASSGIEANIDIKTLSEMMGHKSTAMLDKHYLHVQTDKLHEATQKLSTRVEQDSAMALTDLVSKKPRNLTERRLQKAAIRSGYTEGKVLKRHNNTLSAQGQNTPQGKLVAKQQEMLDIDAVEVIRRTPHGKLVAKQQEMLDIAAVEVIRQLRMEKKKSGKKSEK